MGNLRRSARRVELEVLPAGQKADRDARGPGATFPDADREARERLQRETPQFSARFGPTRAQWTLLTLIFSGLTAGLILVPGPTFTVISLAAGLLFAVSALFRLGLMAASFLPRPAFERTAPMLADVDLPYYSVIVALHQEAGLIRQTVRALTALDYPREKLEILLALEEADAETRAAAARLSLPAHFKIVIVPDSIPRTKPKACNFALMAARGELIALFDAEDHPDPDQLRRAASLLAAADEKTACYQARLGFFNADENLLTRQFALEFALWFDFILAGLDRLGLPIPLGGTSNHFRRSALETVHGWDPFNVTEDADLGIRFARYGFRVRTFASPTAEEANCTLFNWVHQRSRWLKGYMQTYFVHMRRPDRLMNEVGLFGFASFQLLVGGAVLAPFFHLAFWSVMAAAYAGFAFADNLKVNADAADLVIALFVFGTASAVLSALIAAFSRSLRGVGKAGLIFSALTVWLYWFLIGAAVIKAAFSLLSRPFYWAKTRHGLTRFHPLTD